MVVPCLTLSIALLAQAAPPRPAPAPKDPGAASLAQGWTAVAARQYDEAAKVAETLLRRRPWDRAAQVLRIHAFSGVSPVQGLDAYEQWRQLGHAEDAAMLEPVAIAALQEIAKGPKRELHAPALRALLDARVPGARDALDAAKSDAQTRLDLDVDSARNGDAAALQRLQTQAGAAGAPPSLAAAFAELGVSSGEPGLLLAKSTNPQTRAAAAEALGAIKSGTARGAAAQLQKDPDPAVRTAATIALARMGDPDALGVMDQMLASNVPDSQIMAARAFEGRPGPWVGAIRQLLDNQDGLTRIEAAQAIAPVDPEAARRVLGAALADPNPVVRYETARTLEQIAAGTPAGADIAALRQRLRDADPAVRMAVAGALLRLARQ